MKKLFPYNLYFLVMNVFMLLFVTRLVGLAGAARRRKI